MAADLPVIFWCRHQGALSRNASSDQKEGLAAIVNLSQKVIFDSHGMPPADALGLIAGWQKERRVVADLEWTRLTPWREPLCHVFDNETRSNTFSKFHSVEIEHTDDKPSLSALYIAAWLSNPYKARVTFRQVTGFSPGLHRVVLQSENETIEFGRNSAGCATLSSTNGRSRRYHFGEHSLTALLTEELAVAGMDPVFNSAIARVKELAEQN
jgi:glucose-6-phosphate dehydrogenase assembly protein OpcA